MATTRTFEVSVYDAMSGIVHRLCPRDARIARQYLNHVLTEETEALLRSHCSGHHGLETACAVLVSQGAVEAGLVTCIACIAMEGVGHGDT